MGTEQRAKAFCSVLLYKKLRQDALCCDQHEEKACIIGGNDGIPGIPLTKTGH